MLDRTYGKVSFGNSELDEKAFSVDLKSPENASCNQATPQSSIYIRLETINETRRL